MMARNRPRTFHLPLRAHSGARSGPERAAVSIDYTAGGVRFFREGGGGVPAGPDPPSGLSAPSVRAPSWSPCRGRA